MLAHPGGQPFVIRLGVQAVPEEAESDAFRRDGQMPAIHDELSSLDRVHLRLSRDPLFHPLPIAGQKAKT